MTFRTGAESAKEELRMVGAIYSAVTPDFS